MRNLSGINEGADIVTKDYVDNSIPTKTSDLTNDSGFVTTDEKLKTTSSGNSSTQYYPIFGNGTTTAETKRYSSNFRVQNYNNMLTLQLGQAKSSPVQGQLSFVSNQPDSGYTYLQSSQTVNRTIILPDASGTIALMSNIPTVPTKVSDLTNDSGFISTETDPTVPTWAKASDKPEYYATEIAVEAPVDDDYNNVQEALAGLINGKANTSHAHGNITSSGDITATAPTIASGDQLIINDHSASKITNGPTFDGSTTNKYLSPKGTWESLPQGTTYTAGTGLSLSGTQFNHSNSVTAQTTQAVYPIKIDAQGHISAYGSAVTIPTTYVSTITTTAGAHTAITNKSGAVSFNIPTTAAHVGAVPTTRTVNGKALSSDITLSAASATTGISISNHSTGSVIGVQSSTTTASKVTLGTAISVPNVTAVGSGSFTQGSFNGGSLVFAIDSTDNKQLNITFTAATHGADSHTHTAPTLGTAKSIPNVTGVSDVTVPIKNTSASTFVTGTTHSITDNGHTHNLS